VKLSVLALCTVGGLATVTAIGVLTAPRLSAAIRAAFVEVVIPSKPFFGVMTMTPGLTYNYFKSVGPGSGTLGITNITLTNLDTAFARRVNFVNAVFAGSACVASLPPGGGGLIASYGDPQFDVVVQANSTLSISYPTPLVFQGNGGPTCVTAHVEGIRSSDNFEVQITGFVN
jgi:hypothetical protein